MNACPRCGFSGGGQRLGTSRVWRCPSCAQYGIDGPVSPEDARLLAVLSIEEVVIKHATASERLHWIRQRLVEEGAPPASIELEALRARRLWAERYPEPFVMERGTGLRVEVTQEARARGYREPDAIVRRLRARPPANRHFVELTGTGGIALVLFAVGVFIGLASDRAAGAATFTVLGLAMALLFLHTLAWSWSVDVEQGVLRATQRYLFRRTRTIEIAADDVAYVALETTVDAKTGTGSPNVDRVVVVAKDGRRLRVHDGLFTTTAMSLAIHIEAALGLIELLRARVQTDADADAEADVVADVVAEGADALTEALGEAEAE